MKRFAGVFAAVVPVLLSVAPVYAAGVFVNRIYSPGQIDSPSQVEVAVKATCDVTGARTAGFSLRLQQSTADGGATGSGSTEPMTCDGREHRYVETVIASAGTWSAANADVYVSTFYVVCTPNPTGPPVCVANESAYRYEATIQLANRS